MWYVNTTCATVSCPPTSGEGACCYEDLDAGWTCVWTDQGECDNTYFGTWYSGIDCVDIDCLPVDLGACCYTIDCQWYCDMLTPDACEALLGIYYAQSSCSDPNFTCEQEDYGACCYENAAGVMTCVWTNVEKCEFYYFGIWHPNASCECIDCDENSALGACCYMDDSGHMSCTLTTNAACNDLAASTFYGIGSSCSGVVCCLPVGACCLNGTCILASSNECELAQGSFYSVGTLCTQVSCDASCPADINSDGNVDVSDLLILIAAWGVCP